MMIDSESDFIQLQVINFETQDFDAFLVISHDGQNILALRADLDPEAADTIQYDSSQIVKAKAASLAGNTHRGKLWLDGKWSDHDFDFTVVFNKASLQYEVAVVVTDHLP
jgi:hypothetical protein